MLKLAVCKSVGRYGRFANGCFSICGLIGIARRSGFDWALTELWRNHDGRTFEPEIDIDCFKRFVNQMPLYTGPELPERGIPWGYHDVILDRDTDLKGHFQSPRYFEHALDEIKFYFRMIDEGPVNDYVAIHWRSGDYGAQISPQHPDGNSYHPRMALDYYLPAMELFHGAKFLVFSDDIPGARKMFGDSVEYSEGRDYLEDFRLMKKCSHFITANSTFSLMAAILGDARDKQIVAPRPWFGGPYKGVMDESAIYSPEWIQIRWDNRV